MSRTVCNCKSRPFFSRGAGKVRGAAVILLALITWVFPWSALADEPGLPESILGMEKTEVMKGKEASKKVDRMHRGDVATGMDYIVEYSDGDHSATYYVSLYDEPEEAVKAKQEMARKMEETSHEFSHFMHRTVNEHTVYMALAHDQAHYFFAQELELVWLAVDISVAEDALKELFSTK